MQELDWMCGDCLDLLLFEENILGGMYCQNMFLCKGQIYFDVVLCLVCVIDLLGGGFVMVFLVLCDLVEFYILVFVL